MKVLDASLKDAPIFLHLEVVTSELGQFTEFTKSLGLVGVDCHQCYSVRGDQTQNDGDGGYGESLYPKPFIDTSAACPNVSTPTP